MPKNRTDVSATKLLRGLRPSTISAQAFSATNENAALYSTDAAFITFLGAAVKNLQDKGYETFKSGSCFADLAERRTSNTVQYDPEFFHPGQAIVVPGNITNDLDGAKCESHANKMPMMVNVRKMEGGGVTCGFARKEFVFSSPYLYFIDLLFRRFDEKWPSRRPGIVYIVPTGSATVAEFKEVHLSAYNKNYS